MPCFIYKKYAIYFQIEFPNFNSVFQLETKLDFPGILLRLLADDNFVSGWLMCCLPLGGRLCWGHTDHLWCLLLWGEWRRRLCGGCNDHW